MDKREIVENNRVCIIGLNVNREDYDKDEESLDELSLLAETAGFNPDVKLLQRRQKIDPTYYIGYGKAKEVREVVSQNQIDTVLFDFEPSPVQIRNLEKLIKLLSVKKHRMVIRSGRDGKNKVSLVGYTNAGKSSLLNRLSHSDLFTENRMFATLDPATRQVWLGDGITALVTDTVGFIKKLPYSLIASFRSTLEEVKDSDLLIHVVDISSRDALEQIIAVEDVLYEISADELPVLYVFNKIDLMKNRNVKGTIINRYKNSVLVSAKTGEGIDELKQKLREFFYARRHWRSKDNIYLNIK